MLDELCKSFILAIAISSSSLISFVHILPLYSEKVCIVDTHFDSRTQQQQ